ncbi:prostaglandin E2 receptor EP1 subtype [Bos indicus]|uniref:Prostaglandin E2 receptor EP1 subtype n=5 Tax=Bos TaxID=9903 RepID=F1MUY4_BOVIN|nr:prostaglandin E2 receptor EP1 subtype [Bos taurus]XP_005208661.1 prostaglandin E2 receptor EP1 subtype isoform X1 [Bos taurus]XP_027403806.1 prostaglandin E2 receptor EP1 subtype [Bos indicus x Bos taurus]DAA28108.1 TPA: prostaglandin E receptor 1 (subtype EP1), 42kDa [Bos taurus]
MSPCGPLNLSLAGEATTCTAPGAPNTSAGPPLGLAGASPALPIFSMTLGAVSNVLALGLLAQAAGRLRRRRSAATFLLFVASLLATDLAGHVIPGALVLRLYAAGRAPAGGACHFLGGCMVFFGLCPLLLGCGMAVERCVGVTRPLLHAARVSVARARLALAALAAVALAVALLPLARVGRYELQYPGTWCFIGLGPAGGWRQALLAGLFAGLGLASLLAALLCNTLSGLALLRARWRRRRSRRHFPAGGGPDSRRHWGGRGPRSASASSASSVASASAAPGGSPSRGSSRKARAHDVEMVGQLVGIMVVSCICWSPLLVVVVLAVAGWGSSSLQRPLFLAVRLASWNQILDPWVYILLRQAVLRQLLRLLPSRAGAKGSHGGLGLNKSTWEASSLRSSRHSGLSSF